MRGPAATVLAAVITAGALSACGGGTDQAGLVPDLCDAIAAPDVATATEVFEGRVHTPLHALANDVAEVDRGVATRLLEAKYAVETVVRADSDAPAPLVRTRLEDLTERVREALATLDRPAPSC